ncbi:MULTISPECIES: hypothetical protein [Acidianus]|uniref:Uncharacterized protein n=1 Tax=Candidatus Acidianus copahuensis TaxID=1160895 RepID=A0A031LVK1_9CREN|nr:MULTISPECIES: hypothetical protein [Acidianus]EZQ11143.1 hypothetical protein CM19_02810 [Candidatus Acidianus copahuensis]NON63656.1 hypothetical protein [Acidianus sp. RZ1]
MIDKEKLGKKVVHNKLEDCDLYVIEDEKTYLVFIFHGKYIYFKVTPSFPGKWNCEEAIYYPYGLFGFVRHDEDITNKIKMKIEVLKSAGL